MSLAERAALDVLAGQSDADTVGEDRRKGELFGRRPSRPCARPAARASAPRFSRARSSLRWTRSRTAAPGAPCSGSLSRSSGTAVSTFDAAPGGGGSGCGSTKSCSGCSVSSASCKLAIFASVSSSGAAGATSPRSTSVRAQISRTVGCVRDLLIHDRLRERRARHPRCARAGDSRSDRSESRAETSRDTRTRAVRPRCRLPDRPRSRARSES